MAFSVQMPALGESVTEGTVTRWLKQEGDTVEVDEPLLEVSTDKVDTEIPSPAAGTLTKIVAGEDETIEVGGELALIGESAESGGESAGGSGSTSDPGASQGSGDAGETADSGQAEAPAQPQPSAQQEPTGGGSGGSSGSGTPVTMPALGESVTEGTVTRWLKQVGDSIEVDEPLLEVSTDKVDTEVPSPVAGTLLEVSVNEDETVEVGGQIAVIGADSTGSTAAPAPQQQPQQQSQQEQPQQADTGRNGQPEQAPAAQEQPAQEQLAQEQPAAAAPARESAPQQRDGQDRAPYVTPLVRKLASEHGVELSSVTGSGIGGRIRKQDVLAAAEQAQQKTTQQPATQEQPAAAGSGGGKQQPAKQPAAQQPDLSGLRGTVQKASRIRQITAEKTKESLQISAQLTQVHEVDVQKIAQLRARAKARFREQEGVNLTYLPFFAKATVEALKQHPNVNASYNEESKEITYHGSVHLGIAVDTQRGLLSVVIHDASELSIAGLAHRIADLAERARSNQVKPDELTGGTFTVTNIGSNGALFDTPIIVQPQAGMLGTGAVVKRPVVVADEDGNETIGIRARSYLSLTYDHRLVDGADAGRFLTTIRKRLEDGAFDGDLGL